MLDTLRAVGYSYLQLALTPTQFCVPNERPRYYCIARRHDDTTIQAWPFYTDADRILSCLPGQNAIVSVTPAKLVDYLDATVDEVGHCRVGKDALSPSPPTSSSSQYLLQANLCLIPLSYPSVCLLPSIHTPIHIHTQQPMPPYPYTPMHSRCVCQGWSCHGRLAGVWTL